MTLRDLWLMASGRREEMRSHAVSQAILVWDIGELDGGSVYEFIKTGCLEGGGGPLRMEPELRAKVDAKLAEIEANGGRLIV